MLCKNIKQSRLTFKGAAMFFLYLLAIGIPSSLFLTSVSVIGLFLVWLFENITQKTLKKNVLDALRDTRVLSIVVFFTVLCVSVLYSEDTIRWSKEIKIKLPLLIFPFVFYSFDGLTPKKIKKMLLLFVLSTAVVTLINFSVYHIKEVPDIRKMSLFFSHIRFGICIAFSMLFLLFAQFKTALFGRVLLVLWFMFYLIFSESYTGLILFWIGGIMCTLWVLPNKPLKSIFGAGLAIALIYVCGVCYTEWCYFKNKAAFNPTSYPTHSEHGSAYLHNFDNFQIENGYYIWRNVSMSELKSTWQKRSKVSFDKKENNNFMYANIIRYLTSKGLTKDEKGLMALSDFDIQQIENGSTNVRFYQMNPFKKRVYETLWEIDYYTAGIAPINGSLVQRFAFWKNACKAFKKSPMFGYGVGDYKNILENHYHNSDLKDHPAFWLKPHNQFLTVGVQTGLVGLLFLVLCIFYPLFCSRAHPLHLAVIFMLFLSMFFEDTLDTQTGLSLFAFFQSLFTFQKDH